MAVGLSLKPSINWLFVFVPVTVAVEHIGNAPDPALFFCAALAIIPIAGLIVQSTEQIALRTGDTIGGLLNATFGNAPELIISIVALRAGLFDMVRASLIGAILANLLLGLGLAFLLGGLKYHDEEYNASATRVYSSMMLLAVISLAAPSAVARLASADLSAVVNQQSLNLLVALLLLAAYALYLLFALRTHPALFASSGHGEEGEHGKQWSVGRAVGSLLLASVLAAWMSEIMVGAAEGTGKALGMSDTFMGIVFLAGVGSAAEIFSAVAVARKNKLDLSAGIALGSSIQIALFVAPVLVLLSFVLAPHPLTLAFGRPELGALLFTVLIGTVVTGDGRGNWFKGVQLVTVYLILALLFYFMPAITS
jgi:Ca2+:H+ antiporter